MTSLILPLPLTAQRMDDAIAASLRDRPAGLDCVLQQLDEGPGGRRSQS